MTAHWRAKTQLILEAPIEEIWATLADVEHWYQWGHLLPFRTRGPLRPGAPVWLGALRRGWIPFPLLHWQAVEHNRELSWGGRILGNQITHSIMLEDLGAGRVLVRNEEWIDGPLARALPTFLSRPYAALLAFATNRGLQRHFR